MGLKSIIIRKKEKPDEVFNAPDNLDFEYDDNSPGVRYTVLYNKAFNRYMSEFDFITKEIKRQYFVEPYGWNIFDYLDKDETEEFLKCHKVVFDDHGERVE